MFYHILRMTHSKRTITPEMGIHSFIVHVWISRHPHVYKPQSKILLPYSYALVLWKNTLQLCKVGPCCCSDRDMCCQQTDGGSLGWHLNTSLHFSSTPLLNYLESWLKLCLHTELRRWFTGLVPLPTGRWHKDWKLFHLWEMIDQMNDVFEANTCSSEPFKRWKWSFFWMLTCF